MDSLSPECTGASLQESEASDGHASLNHMQAAPMVRQTTGKAKEAHFAGHLPPGAASLALEWGRPSSVARSASSAQ